MRPSCFVPAGEKAGRVMGEGWLDRRFLPAYFPDADTISRVLGGLHTMKEPDLHVLFVCTGNICRSPIAERLAAATVLGADAPQITVSSAGVRAVVGHPIHPSAALVLEGMGGQSENFAARQFTPRIGAGADLIVAMAVKHRDTVLQHAPALFRRTFTMSELTILVGELGVTTIADLSGLRAHVPQRELVDVADPIGRDLSTFQEVGEQIAAALPSLLKFCGGCVAAEPGQR